MINIFKGFYLRHSTNRNDVNIFPNYTNRAIGIIPTLFNQKCHGQLIPECFLYNVGRQNKQEPRDLQKCTVSYP
jgi:hypothetical protein